MALYYLLLFVTPFHNDPRLGKVLVDLGGGAVVTPVKILGLSAVAAGLLAPALKHTVPRLQTPLPWFFILFAVIPVACTLTFYLSTPGWYVSQLVSAALLFIATRRLVRTRERMYKVMRTLVLAFAFGSLWVYKQHILDRAINSTGLEGEPNYEALMLLLSIPMGFCMWRYEEASRWRWLGLGCALLLVGAIPLTNSRGGVIAAGAVGLLATMRARRKWMGLLSLALAAFLLFNYGPPALSQKFHSIKFTGEAENGDEGSSRIHVELLKAGLRMMEHHPIFGIGLEQFKAQEVAYNPEILQLSRGSLLAHDTFVQIGAESGIPVLVLFLAMIGIALRNFGKTYQTSDPRLIAMGRAMQLGLIGICVAATSITVELLPFFLLIFLSPNFREVAQDALLVQRSKPRPSAEIETTNPASMSLAANEA